ncbi:hypothetical protein C8F01DRAFT_1379468 [Mycena amicta]|nr:hypothetical protein C8F01DRAFT_1379468 [Mycena amicta]
MHSSCLSFSGKSAANGGRYHALWRTLALNLKIHLNSRERLVALEELVAGWIERSGQQSLHLSLSAFYTDSWAFDFITHFLEKDASRKPPRGFPFYGDSLTTQARSQTIIAPLRSSLLRDFAFSSHMFLYIPWAQLIRFTASDGLETAHALTILHLATRLEEFTKHSIERWDTLKFIDLSKVTELTHPYLRKLDIYESSAHRVLRLLCLPELEDLSLKLSFGETSVENLRAFVVHSDCRLKRLTLRIFTGTREQLRTIFSALSQLEELSSDFLYV